MLALSTRIKLFYLFHFAKPAADRQLYRAVYERKPKSILQIGLGNGERTERILESLQLAEPSQVPHLSVIDIFEAGGSPCLTLKEAHRRFHSKVARLRLIPGDPLAALSRTANSLGQFEMVVIAADVGVTSLNQAWFYFPRVMNPQSVVFLEPIDPAAAYQIMGFDQVETLAAKSRVRRAA